MIGSVHDAVPFHDARVSVILFTAVSTVSGTFTKPTNAYKNSVPMCYPDVNPDWTINMEITAINSATLPNKHIMALTAPIFMSLKLTERH